VGTLFENLERPQWPPSSIFVLYKFSESVNRNLEPKENFVGFGESNLRLGLQASGKVENAEVEHNPNI